MFAATLLVLSCACAPGPGIPLDEIPVLRLKGPPLSVDTRTLPDHRPGGWYDESVAISGGVEPYSVSIVYGRLPPGIQLENERIRGDSSVPGVYDFELEVRDAAAVSTRVELRLSVVSESNDPGISLVVSRKSGPAPLAVFFDATETSSKGYPSVFHHLDYQWDFGDPGSRHSRSTGPVAAHVFDRPGTYRVQLTVVEPGGNTGVKTVTIKATDPDLEFTGKKTVCFSNDKDFTGAPDDAQRVVTQSFETALNYYSAGRRLLFKRGDTFTNGSTRFLSANGLGVLGAFGQGTNRDERGIFANNPVISCTDTPLRFQGSGYTIMDLRFVDASGNTHSVINPNVRTEYVLVYRVMTTGFAVPVGWSHDTMQNRKLDPHDHNMLVDSAVEDFRLNGFYGGGTRLAFIGNSIARCATSHLLRVTFANLCTIDGNVLHFPGGRRHAIKVHAHQDKTRYGQYSERIVIRDNDVRGESWAVAVGPQDALKNEEVRQVLIEKNRIYSIAGATCGVYLACSDTTVRNNLFIGAGSQGFDYWSIRVTRRGIEPVPSGVEIYHNTRYNPLPGHQVEYLIHAENHQGPILIKNNLIWAPKSGQQFRLISGGASTTTGGNLEVDPRFRDPSKLDLTLTANSPAVGAGVFVPVSDDFAGNRRKARVARDVGAYQR